MLLLFGPPTFGEGVLLVPFQGSFEHISALFVVQKKKKKCPWKSWSTLLWLPFHFSSDCRLINYYNKGILEACHSYSYVVRFNCGKCAEQLLLSTTNNCHDLIQKLNIYLATKDKLVISDWLFIFILIRIMNGHN